jgi:hypothetical protein
MKLGPLQRSARTVFTAAMPYIPASAFGPAVKLASQVGLLHTYQSFYIRDGEKLEERQPRGAAARRLCWDRLRPILANLDGHSGTSLDIGSNEGFFTLALADHGYRAQGLDPDLKNVRLAQGISRSLRLPNARFSLGKLTPSNVGELEEYDVILCLSVFHFWVGEFGQDPAVEIMMEMARRCRSRLFFESGQPSDPVYRSLMSFMEPDPREWIHDLLTRAGFPQVDCVGQFSFSGEDEASGPTRYLFVASRES